MTDEKINILREKIAETIQAFLSETNMKAKSVAVRESKILAKC